MHAFFTWWETRSVLFASSFRSHGPEIRSEGHVLHSGTKLAHHYLHEWSCAAFLIGRSAHQAQLSVSFETVISSFPHDVSCSFLCEHREQVQQCRRLLFVSCRSCHHRRRLSRSFQQSWICCIERTGVSIEREVPVNRSLC